MRRSDPNVIMAIEKCIMRGRPVMLENCEEYIDSMVTPIIQHRNTSQEHDENGWNAAFPLLTNNFTTSY